MATPRVFSGVGRKDDDDLRRIRPSQATFRQFLLGERLSLHEIIDRLIFEDIGVEEFGDRFYESIRDGHAEAWGLGRGRAGDLDDSDFDFLEGRRIADLETEFLEGFLRDLEGDRYRDEESGQLKEGPVKVRADLYAQKMRGSAGQAFVNSGEAEEELNWVLGAVEEHCEECPQYAELSPFVRDTLFAIPGDGSTPCLSNCKCFLVRASDGIECFKPVVFPSLASLAGA